GDSSPSSAGGSAEGVQIGENKDSDPGLPPGDASSGDASEPDIDPDLAGFVRPEASSSSPSSSPSPGQNIDIFSLTGQHLWRELGRSESQNPEGPRIRKALEAQCALRQRLLEVAKAVKHHAGRSRDTIDRRNARLREALRGAHTTSTGDQQQQASTTTNNNSNGPYADLTRTIPPAVSPPLPVDPSVRLVRVDANR
ncbi:Phosphatidylinositol 3-kinase catalytic subunit type 3, partial [Perkinsus olseni]